MKKSMQKVLFILSFTSLFSLFCGCAKNSRSFGRLSPDSSNEPSGRQDITSDLETGIRILTIGTADSGGTMYPVGNAIAQAISGRAKNIKVNISASNGSLTNVEAIRNGQIDLALVSGDVAFCAYNGTEEFAENPAKELRAIAAVYSSLSNWIAADSSGLTYVHDLEGKRIALGPKDSTTELSARTALGVLGLDETNTIQKNYGLGSGGIEVERGNLDALHGFAGIPVNGLAQLADSIPCRILQYTSEELEQILSQNQYYYQTVIPAGTYEGQASDVKTFGVKCLICVSADMDEELVYQLTQILDESRPQLIESHETMAPMDLPSFVCQDLPIPLHSGAKRYYLDAEYISE